MRAPPEVNIGRGRGGAVTSNDIKMRMGGDIARGGLGRFTIGRLMAILNRLGRRLNLIYTPIDMNSSWGSAWELFPSIQGDSLMSLRTQDKSRINVLLFLSYDQQPPPDMEMVELADICLRRGEVYFATTRNVSEVSEGAEVAFYADGREDFSVLATAEFIRFIPKEDEESKSILSRHDLYGAKSPKRMRGFVHLRRLQLVSESLDDLNGWLADGRALKRALISTQEPEASIYYVKRSDPAPSEVGIDTNDQLRLWQAKCWELEDKYVVTRQLWEEDIDRIIRDYRSQLDEALSKRSGAVKGGPKRAAKIVTHLMKGAFPDIQLLPDSAEAIVLNYAKSDSLFQCLRDLQREGEMRSAKPVQGLSKCYERRFGDNLGRIYYRRTPHGNGPFYQVLISQKDTQKRDIEYLRSL